MTKKLLGIFAVGLLISLGAASANAQDMGKISVFAGYSWTTNTIDNSICQGDFTNSGCSGTTGLSGYSLSGVWNLSDHIGLEGSFDGHNGSPTGYSCISSVGDCYYSGDTSETTKLNQDLYTYTFGPKFTVPVGSFSLFAHVLVGGAHAHEGVINTYCYTSGGIDPCGTADTGQAKGDGFAFKTGGGVDWNHGHFGIRILEVDYVHVSATVTGEVDGQPYTVKFPASLNNIQLATGITFNLGK